MGLDPQMDCERHQLTQRDLDYTPEDGTLYEEKMKDMREDGFYGAPDLVVEVTSSKPQLDRYVKFHKSARSGIPNFWIVDPEARRLEAFELHGDRYRRVAEHKDAGDFRPALFPGLSIEIEPLWPV